MTLWKVSRDGRGGAKKGQNVIRSKTALVQNYRNWHKSNRCLFFFSFSFSFSHIFLFLFLFLLHSLRFRLALHLLFILLLFFFFFFIRFSPPTAPLRRIAPTPAVMADFGQSDFVLWCWCGFWCCVLFVCCCCCCVLLCCCCVGVVLLCVVLLCVVVLVLCCCCVTLLNVCVKAAGVSHDSPRTPNVHISGSRCFKHHQNSTRRHPERDRKNENGSGRGKKARNFGPLTLRGPTLWGHDSHQIQKWIGQNWIGKVGHNR